MIYVALLRGINVGGNNKVSMQQLKVTFEQAGMSAVSTYINSGNVIFANDSLTPNEIASLLETAIEKDFGFPVKVLLRNHDNIKAINEALPDSWQNNTETKCDVMFLWEAVDSPKVLEQFTIKPGIDQVRYQSGAILWCVARQYVTKSGLLKIVGTPLYKQMTIRNTNTVRKLLNLMEQTASSKI